MEIYRNAKPKPSCRSVNKRTRDEDSSSISSVGLPFPTKKSYEQPRDNDSSSISSVDLPVPKEGSYEQLRDDSSSISSVDYSYSEEEGDKSYKCDEDEDEDEDEDLEEDEDEVVMTDSTATKKNKEIVSTTERGLQEKLEWHTRGFNITLQSKVEQWVCSWNAQTPFVWVNVYAYYNKHKLYGGYGVILRDSDAKPITAAAKFSVVGKSFYTQVLMGVKAGVTLVKNLRLPKLRVICNSIKIPNIIYQFWDCDDSTCRESKDYTYMCEWCWKYFTLVEGCDRDLVPHAREIKALTHEDPELLELTGYLGYWNEAAYYLAKMGKKNRPKVENKEERIASSDEGTGEIKPCDFPQELKQILWTDAEGVFREMPYRRPPIVTQV